MKARTFRAKPIACPRCKREQRIDLLVVPNKPTVLISKQTVLCVECGRAFDLIDEPKIVDGPFAV